MLRSSTKGRTKSKKTTKKTSLPNNYNSPNSLKKRTRSKKTNKKSSSPNSNSPNFVGTRTRSKISIKESVSTNDVPLLKKAKELNNYEENDKTCEATSSQNRYSKTKVNRKRITFVKDCEESGTGKTIKDFEEKNDNKESDLTVQSKRTNTRTKPKQNNKFKCAENKEISVNVDSMRLKKYKSNTNNNKIDYKIAIEKECLIQISQTNEFIISNENQNNKNEDELKINTIAEGNNDRKSKHINKEQVNEILNKDNPLIIRQPVSEPIEERNIINSKNVEKDSQKPIEGIQMLIPSKSSNNAKSDYFVKKRKLIDSDNENYVKLPCKCNNKIQCYGPFNGDFPYSVRSTTGLGVQIKKSLKHEKHILAGFLKIFSDSCMSGKATNNTVYFVLEGQLNVNISGNIKEVNVDDCFMVLQDSVYEIKNIRKEPARLSFVKTSRIL